MLMVSATGTRKRLFKTVLSFFLLYQYLFTHGFPHTQIKVKHTRRESVPILLIIVKITTEQCLLGHESLLIKQEHVINPGTALNGIYVLFSTLGYYRVHSSLCAHFCYITVNHTLIHSTLTHAAHWRVKVDIFELVEFWLFNLWDIVDSLSLLEGSTKENYGDSGRPL